MGQKVLPQLPHGGQDFLALLAFVTLGLEPLTFVGFHVGFEGLQVCKGSVAVPTAKWKNVDTGVIIVEFLRDTAVDLSNHRQTRTGQV